MHYPPDASRSAVDRAAALGPVSGAVNTLISIWAGGFTVGQMRLPSRPGGPTSIPFGHGAPAHDPPAATVSLS